MAFANRGSFTSFPIWMFFNSFTCLISLGLVITLITVSLSSSPYCICLYLPCTGYLDFFKKYFFTISPLKITIKCKYLALSVLFSVCSFSIWWISINFIILYPLLPCIFFYYYFLPIKINPTVNFSFFFFSITFLLRNDRTIAQYLIFIIQLKKFLMFNLWVV